VIVIPVVVRNHGRHADIGAKRVCARRRRRSALPRAHMVIKIAYRAARAGILTGILLAIARIRRRNRAAAVSRR